ncbi:hypothetical protein S40285_10115 [Stachybotrys chlorohalonatus IBT 40285]|uniref:Uncharacterized protein n=1 Tax=Stachybotrys chlorohalonatus (strain IBT 40285) TaxID=1283841 RepID=A0A084QVI0_STAC4|nr:hypothetical protein S40285_10115 [Stachybotrys chlorohalonata IBT 40285]
MSGNNLLSYRGGGRGVWRGMRGSEHFSPYGRAGYRGGRGRGGQGFAPAGPPPPPPPADNLMNFVDSIATETVRVDGAIFATKHSVAGHPGLQNALVSDEPYGPRSFGFMCMPRSGPDIFRAAAVDSPGIMIHGFFRVFESNQAFDQARNAQGAIWTQEDHFTVSNKRTEASAQNKSKNFKRKKRRKRLKSRFYDDEAIYKCGNCGGDDHNLEHCIRADDSGLVPGCPSCNTTAQTAMVYQEIILHRCNMPGLKLEDESWPNQAYTVLKHYPELVSKGLPWSPQFVREMTSTQVGQPLMAEYETTWDSRFLVPDPSVKTLEAFCETFGFDATVLPGKSAGEAVVKKEADE